MASMFGSFRILICSCVFLPPVTFGFHCPGPVNPRNGFSYARIESNISGRTNEEYAKIRTKLIYDPSVEGKPYKEVVQEAADFWTKALSVKPVSGRLFKSRDCKSENRTTYKALDKSSKKEIYCLGSCKDTTKCMDFEIPKEHLDGCRSCNEEGNHCTKQKVKRGTGIENADLVFYVSAIRTAVCLNLTGLVAYAGACELEPVLNRPVFAVINICPRLGAKSADDKKAMLRTIKHEMMHAFGFSSVLFKYFRDKEGKPLWPRDETGQPITNNETNMKQSIIKNVARDWHVRRQVIKVERTFFVTPNVVKESRNHFACPDLEGAELEDQGSAATEYSHFEARIFYDDGMKGNTDSGKGLFSRLDFAVLEDSGWYEVNYSQAENMEYGRNLGCDFCMRSCKFWMDRKRKEGQSIEPYCDSPDLGCRRGLFHIGTKTLFSGCPLGKVSLDYLEMLYGPKTFENFTELPLKYQNFDHISGVTEKELPAYGSYDLLADFCPIPVHNFEIKRYRNVTENIECDRQTKQAGEPKKAEIPKPAQEAKDELHQVTNQSARLNWSVLLVSIFTLMVIIL